MPMQFMQCHIFIGKLSVISAKCHYAVIYAKCHYAVISAKCHYAVIYAKCPYVVIYAEFRLVVVTRFFIVNPSVVILSVMAPPSKRKKFKFCSKF